MPEFSQEIYIYEISRKLLTFFISRNSSVMSPQILLTSCTNDVTSRAAHDVTSRCASTYVAASVCSCLNVVAAVISISVAVNPIWFAASENAHATESVNGYRFAKRTRD